MEERQTKYTIAEGYDLPSKGLIYDVPVNAHVELRSMTARDELKRLSPSTTPLKTLADIIEGCMIEKPAIHVYDMCLGDYEYLLHKLRIISYGPDYSVSLTCPYCGKVIEDTLDLSTLEKKEFDLEKLEDIQTFTLPRSNKVVKLKFQTPRMLDEQDAKVREKERKYKNAEIDFGTLLKITRSIDSIDGKKLNSLELEEVINKLPALDMQKILNNIELLNSLIGLDTKFFVSCPACGNEIQTFFRFGPEFFRPANI